MRRLFAVAALALGLVAGGTINLAIGSPAEDDGEELPLADPVDATTERPEPVPDGVRTFRLVAEERAQPIFRDIRVPVIALDGRFPGPTIRSLANESVKIVLVNDASRRMTLHFHGMHEIAYDGVHEIVEPGGSTTYWLNGTPPGVYMYHSHILPLARTENRVASGAFIVDPVDPRPPAKELVMLAKADDTDDDFEEAEFYTYNGVANRYLDDPIELGVDETLRLYVVNVNIEQITLFHVHGTVYEAQTMGRGNGTINDNTPVGYGERTVVEASWSEPGLWMFHDHIAEHMERGLMGWVEVRS